MSDQIELNSVVRDFFEKYPPVLKIEQVSEILRENSQTTRDRIRRGTFPVRVIKEVGSRHQVLLIDLLDYLTSGKRQIPLPRELREKAGFKKRGRPTKAEQLAKMGAESCK